MDETHAIERITENENLTDGLEDGDASWLLQWGTSHVRSLIAGAKDDEAAGEKINGLMAIMRSLNAIAASRAVETPANLRKDFQALRDQYIATFGSATPHREDAIARLISDLPRISAREAMQKLLVFLEAPAPEPGTVPAAPPANPHSEPAPETRPSASLRDSLRQRITSFAQGIRRHTALLLTVVGVVALVAVVVAVVADVLRRQPSPGQVTTPPSAITVYFTNPATQATNGIDQYVVADLDRAKKTIDVASFDFNLPDVTDALARAQSRGVVVRVVLDEVNGTQILRASDAPGKKQTDALQALAAAHIPVVDGGRSNGLMHNKFILIDGAILFVGSWNMSFNDTFRNNNNLLRITHSTLIANYQAKFEEMFVKHLFGAKSTVGALTPKLTVGGVAVENYFSPRDKVMSKLVAQVRGATKSVHFLAFAYTSADLANAMIAKKNAGVTVEGVIESRGASQGALPGLFCAGIAVKTDGNPNTMHDKVIILDGETVITGSFNFTQSADAYNDENVVILHDRALATLYEQEFGRIVAAAKQPTNVNCAAARRVAFVQCGGYCGGRIEVVGVSRWVTVR